MAETRSAERRLFRETLIVGGTLAILLALAYLELRWSR